MEASAFVRGVGFGPLTRPEPRVYGRLHDAEHYPSAERIPAGRENYRAGANYRDNPQAEQPPQHTTRIPARGRPPESGHPDGVIDAAAPGVTPELPTGGPL
jgi:hypothetical protein